MSMADYDDVWESLCEDPWCLAQELECSVRDAECIARLGYGRFLGMGGKISMGRMGVPARFSASSEVVREIVESFNE